MYLVFQKTPDATVTDVKIQDICSDISLLNTGRHQKSQHSFTEQMKEPLPSEMTGKSATSVQEICISTVKSDMRLETQARIMQDAAREMEDDLLFFDEQRQRYPGVITEKANTLSHPLTFHSLAQARGYPLLTDVEANMKIIDRRADSILQPSSIGPLPRSYS